LRIQRGLVKISTVTLLEVGFSTRNGADHRSTLGEPPVSSMPIRYLTPAIEARAVEIQMLLADRGHHRAPSIPDLLIAATGELSRLTVLHVDEDFDLIAAITDQPLDRLDILRARCCCGHAKTCRRSYGFVWPPSRNSMSDFAMVNASSSS
jgi:predicted nucleic acid-binding protein